MSNTPIDDDRAVPEYLGSIEDEQTRQDAETLQAMMQKITGHQPKLWNVGSLGFDEYHYKYDSGREGDCHALGFYPRKDKLTFYLMDGTDRHTELLAKLGKHTKSKACLYIKRLSDIDLSVLEQILASSYDNVKNGRYMR